MDRCVNEDVGTKIEDEQIIEMPLEIIYSFASHPFKVRDDEEMHDLVDSIIKHGQLYPGIVRPRKK